MKKKNLTGDRYGRFIVIEKSDNRGKNIAWKCKCNCGQSRNVLAYNLISGKSKSCGCARRESLSKKFRTHGDSGTKLYSIYKGMKQRCYNKNNPAYKYYGGKGVKICGSWLSDYLTFKKWALINGYKEGFLSIDRIDPNGDYSPYNCRWVTMRKQQNNKLNSMFVTIGNEKLTIAEWADEIGTKKPSLYDKFYRLLHQLDLENKEVKEFRIILKK